MQKRNIKQFWLVNASIVMQVVTCLAIFAEILTLNVFSIQTAYAVNPASATDYIDLSQLPRTKVRGL